MKARQGDISASDTCPDYRIMAVKLLEMKDLKQLLNCEDIELLSRIRESLDYFSKIPKDLDLCLSFSGGKDSHVLLGIYNLYLMLGNKPFPNLTVKFADTLLELRPIYKVCDLVKTFCDQQNIPFILTKPKNSYWFIQYAYGYPVPNFRVRWCTGKLKVQPMQPSRRIKAITGRHLGESLARDNKLKSCGSSSCGEDLIKDKYDPLINWRNCQIWDALYYFDSTVLYKGVFEVLQKQYSVSEDTKTGSLRMGCFMCPVVSTQTLLRNQTDGLIGKEAIEIRSILEDLREARRINNPRTKKAGAIYIGDRRESWKKLQKYKEYLFENSWATEEDFLRIEKALESDHAYPPTYKKEWIDSCHQKLKPKSIQLELVF